MVNGPAAQAAMANAYELVSSASSLRLHAGPQGEGAHRAGSALEAQTRRAISSGNHVSPVGMWCMAETTPRTPA